MMEVVVTGATGFVGRWLVDELLRQGDGVTVIARDKERIPDRWRGKVPVIEASLEGYEELKKESFPKRGYDILFHLAWEGSSGSRRSDIQLQMQNARYTCDAVQLASMLQCSRFVYAGSIMEYEAMQGIPREGSRPGVSSIYSTAKLAADFMAKALAAEKEILYINAVISNIFGPGEHSARFLNTTLNKMLQNEDIQLTHGRQLYDFIYARDAARAIVLAGKAGNGYTAYYIGNVRQKQLKEFVLQMKDAIGSRSRLLFGHVPFYGVLMDYKRIDTGNIARLGFVPEVGFPEGIRLTSNWIQGEENGY